MIKPERAKKTRRTTNKNLILIEEIKTVLGEKVKEVRLSHRLTTLLLVWAVIKMHWARKWNVY